MSREIKTETDMFGNKTEVVYENGSKVGEVQHRSGFLSGGDFIVENNGNTSRIVKNSALDPFTSPDTEIRDSSWNRTGRIEKSNTPHTRTIVDERSSGGSGG